MNAGALEGSDRRDHIAHVDCCPSVCGCVGFVFRPSLGALGGAQLEKRAKDGMKTQMRKWKGRWRREYS
jgi:hypothetical protein